MKKVYIIILNYKNWIDVNDCLASVFTSSYQPYSVIVIDNDSGNNSLEHIHDFIRHSYPAKMISFIDNSTKDPRELLPESDLIFLQNSVNRGFAGGINPVIKMLSRKDAYIWLLNPDTTIQTDTLSELVCFAEKGSGKTIIGANIFSFKEPAKHFLFGGGRINFSSATISVIKTPQQKHRIDYISGSSLFTEASTYSEIGLLPEDYFLYWEETEWCYRARKKGFQLQVCPTAILFDKGSTSIGKSFLADFYYTRNGLVFVSKFKRSKVPLALISAILRAGKRILKGDLQRARGVLSGLNAFLKQAV